MDINFMRRIDSWAGIPLCLVLDLFARLRGALFGAQDPDPMEKVFRPKEIVAMKFLGMGSIILASPALKAIRDTFPEAKLTFLTFDKNKQLPELLNVADEVLVIRTFSPGIFLWDVAKAVLTLRRRRPELTLDLEFFSKFSLILAFVIGSPRRVGYGLREPWRSGPMLTRKVPFNPYRHITEIFFALVHAAGVSDGIPNKIPPIQASEEAKQRVHRLLEQGGYRSGQRLVIINPNSGEMALQRRWPAERFRKLARWLAEERGCFVVFIGGAEEAEYVASVMEGVPEGGTTLNLSGLLDLEELSVILAGSDLLVTNDSGPLHLASVMGTPTVSLFGPESPLLYGPMGSNHRVLYKCLYCSPCLSVYNTKETRCLDNRCLKEISLEEVKEAVDDLLCSTSTSKGKQISKDDVAGRGLETYGA